MGWIGETKLLQEWLEDVKADRHPTGQYVVQGTPPCFGLGGDEVVVGDDAQVRIDGAWVYIAARMIAHGIGMPVTVIA